MIFKKWLIIWLVITFAVFFAVEGTAIDPTYNSPSAYASEPDCC